VAWLRRPGRARLDIVVGGRPSFPPAVAPPADGGPGPGRARGLPVLYPPGAMGTPLADGEVALWLSTFPAWIRCGGAPDALWATDGPNSGPRGAGAPARPPARGSFDDCVAHLGEPFVWLVVAEPVDPAVSERELADLMVTMPYLRRQESSADGTVELERAQARYRELVRAGAAGLWDVHILVGSVTARDATAAAALLCGSSDLDDLPYVLVPGSAVTSFDAAVRGHWPRPGPSGGPGPGPGGGYGPGGYGGGPAGAGGLTARQRGMSPFAATGELLAAIARPPSRELPGVNLVTPHTFDVTPEHVPTDGTPGTPGGPGGPSGPGALGTAAAGVPLGEVLDAAWMPAGPMPLPPGTLNRHGFVCGATGSGKSQTVRAILEGLARAPRPVPWLVIEPAKAEYAGMAGRLAGHAPVVVIKPGLLDVAPASLNPLEPERGFPLQSHLDLVRALFLAAFEANEPFPQVLSRALTVCYTEAGWDLVADRPRPAVRPKLALDEPDRPVRRRYPTLGDLQRTARRVVEGIGYGAEITADVRGFVDVRMGSLREGRPGRFFEGGHPLDVGALLRANVVIELEDITNDQDKAFLMGAVLIRIVEHLRVRYGRGGAGGLRHVLVVEEAHRLLRNVTEGPAAAAVELFSSLLAEIRAYGEGVLVVEQIPAKIVNDVVKNTALKIMHRLPAADDREAVGAAMNLRPDQSELVVSLPPGVAAVTVDGMDRPILVGVRAGEDRESPAAAAFDGAPLAGRRSPHCGAACRARPCALGEINDAAVLAGSAAVVVWIEVVTVWHVLGLWRSRGWPPAPGRVTRTALAAAEPRVLTCALALAAERATGARREWLREFVDPDDLTARILDVLATMLRADGMAVGDGPPTDATAVLGPGPTGVGVGGGGVVGGMPRAGHDGSRAENPAPAHLEKPAFGESTAFSGHGTGQDLPPGTPGTPGTPGGAAGIPDQLPPDPAGARWTAGMYRWQDVRAALLDAASAPEPPPGRHPSSGEWERRGLILAGASVAEQLEALRASPVYALGQDRVATGDVEVSGLAEAVRILGGGLTASALTYAIDAACPGPATEALVAQLTDHLTPASGQAD